MAETKSDSMVLFQYFGLLEGETRSDFIGELKQLTDEDKKQLADGIRDESFTY